MARTSSSSRPTSTASADERVVIGHQLALGEVGEHQALLHRVLEAVLGGEVDDAVAVEGRAAALDVQVEVEALAGGGVGHRAAPSPWPARP